MENNIEVRNNNELNKAIQLAQHTVYKNYLTQLEQYALLTPTEILLDEKTENCVRFLKLKKLTCKRGEDIIQKLTNVYHASMLLGCSLIVLIDVEKNDAPVNIYVGLRKGGVSDEDKAVLRASFKTLESGIKSNFPGTETEHISSKDVMPDLIEEMFGNTVKHICSVSCVASLRDKSKTENKNFIQGLERFIDAMRGKAYTAVFIAEPINDNELKIIRNGFESLYSTLSSFKRSTWSFNETNSEAVMKSLSEGISNSITEGTSSTQAHAINVGMNIGIGGGVNTGTITTNGKSSPTTVARIGQGLSALGTVGQLVTLVNPAIGGALMGVSALGNAMTGGSTSNSVAETIGKSLGLNAGIGAGYTDTKTSTTSHNETETISRTTNSGTTNTKSKGKTLQIENINKPIEEMLNRIQEQLKRLREEEDYGAYSCGAYFLSGRQENCLLAANTYRALMLGEGSSVETSAINSWHYNNDPDKVDMMKEYLKRFVQPMFVMPFSTEVNTIDDVGIYTPGTIVSGLELPLHLGLPTKSVYGLPVVEHAEFGRNVLYKDESSQENSCLELGKIYHMGQVEKKSRVDLKVSSLASHTFVTGSTGAGKSNTVYQILKELNEKKIHYLVIEPAKGEYKHIFGNEIDVNVYGTNPAYTPLLKINPFKFPNEIHVLEHIDRLIEIFNVCWPMYAAMPAVLKDSVERAYISAGWDLLTSTNKYSNKMFPTFADVLDELNLVVAESAFSQEVKDNYIGSLSTRIKSLTNGIYGHVFSNDELGDELLFDSNVIIDLSRIGSIETKSMIMGILVMRLQEYRMTSYMMNAELRHVTILEEAHNLLKRTSVEQSGESSNLLGKAVEMLSNAIAEVRTYGEGFIIADQAPGLLDVSVIRNTNTKIIMRLPDAEDRTLVGKAAGLNDEQIKELAKLPTGVAAVYQNNWLEPVLCQINYSNNNEKYINKRSNFLTATLSKGLLIRRLLNKVAGEQQDLNIEEMINQIVISPLKTRVKRKYINVLRSNGKVDLSDIQPIIYDLVCTPTIEKELEETESIEEWMNTILYAENSLMDDFKEHEQNMVVECILREQISRFNKPEEYLEQWYEFIGRLVI